METIGLSKEDITALVVSLKVELTKEQEETTRSTAAYFVSQGCSKDEAYFRAGTLTNSSVDSGILMGIIDANNKRILSDLQRTGLLPH